MADRQISMDEARWVAAGLVVMLVREAVDRLPGVVRERDRPIVRRALVEIEEEMLRRVIA